MVYNFEFEATTANSFKTTQVLCMFTLHFMMFYFAEQFLLKLVLQCILMMATLILMESSSSPTSSLSIN